MLNNFLESLDSDREILLDYWSITDDGNVKTVASDPGFPVEIVSPVLRFRNDWRGEVREVWNRIKEICVVRTNPTCSTHIHVSLSRKWTLEDVKAVARCATFFEPAVAMLPPGIKLLQTDMCKLRIDECLTMTKLAELVNDGGNRYFGFNFSNLWYGTKGTIEFRCPPGVIVADDSLEWAEFFVTFVIASVTQRR
ncbi:hypothetical protein BDD12DRAFT_808649 [Trichophaea hybrida]|nr:hypothetical protein BDD12DRAFT_808649 [Trichophaea hybrida]